MNRFIHRSILIPAFETVYHRRRTFRYLAELEKSQWLPREQLEAKQFASLQKIILHSYAHCPYYRDLWNESGCAPASLKSPEDFSRWPTTTREDIKDNRARMRADLSMKLIAKSTGGSSGVPLRFDLNLDSNDRRCAAAHRGYAWAGAELGTKMFYLWGAPLEQSVRGKIKDALYRKLYRQKLVNSFCLTDHRVPQILATLNRYHADFIVAYTNPLYDFARALREQGLHPRSPRGIIVGAEKLHPFQRQVIEEVFRAPVFETYGSREVMLMSAECDRHEGLHLTSESLLIEILDDDGQPTPAGEEGNVVVTDLFNYGMPFIRYVNGDRGIAGWKQCSCGRGLPLMQPPKGRQLDILQLSDGRRIAGELFPHLLKDFAPIRRFQIVQDSIDRIQIRLVTSPRLKDIERAQIERALRAIVGSIVRLDIVEVESIELTKSGKLRVVVNACPISTSDKTTPVNAYQMAVSSPAHSS